MVPSASPNATPPALDVVGVGNALVDVISTEEESFLADHELVKGSMALVDADRAKVLYGAMGPGLESSGGSAANTLAGLASFGGRGGFIGRVHDDELGEVFAHDIRAIGVEFPVRPASAGSPTGRCLVVVTPDGERTMSTLLGAAGEIGPAEIDEEFVASAAITYLEGYLFDTAPAREAFAKASASAHAAGRRVALTLSDSFCVARARQEFLDLIQGDIDILVGNEEEMKLLYETDDVDGALARAAAHCEIVVVTRSAAGSSIASGGTVHHVPAEPVAKVVDTTGAGDQFAAGFLFGLTQGLDLERCGRLGSLAAAEVISHVGARPEVSLADLAAPLLG